MRVAIIPARGGSKRIPRKNVRSFAGRPMIAHAIGAARQAAIFDRIIVSTDDDEIAAIARAEGAEVPFRRPARLADDHTATVPVVAHAIQACSSAGWDVRQACCIYAAAPLISSRDVVDALSLLEANDNKGYVFPVAPFPSAIQRALRCDEARRVQPLDPRHVDTRTQDLEPAYFDAGQFYWASAATWLSGAPVHGNGSAIVLPQWRVVDIDTPEDWERAELVYTVLRSRASR